MRSPFGAAALLRADDAVLRGAGLSAGKVLTLRAAAAAVAEGRLALDGLAALPAEEVAARLTALRGIGPWTAQLYLLSCLGHADAWPPGDVALEEAARLALKLDARPSRARAGSDRRALAPAPRRRGPPAVELLPRRQGAERASASGWGMGEAPELRTPFEPASS